MKREAHYFHQDTAPTQTDHKQFPLMVYRLYGAHENCRNILWKWMCWVVFSGNV